MVADLEVVAAALAEILRKIHQMDTVGSEGFGAAVVGFADCKPKSTTMSTDSAEKSRGRHREVVAMVGKEVDYSHLEENELAGDVDLHHQHVDWDMLGEAAGWGTLAVGHPVD